MSDLQIVYLVWCVVAACAAFGVLYLRNLIGRKA